MRKRGREGKVSLLIPREEEEDLGAGRQKLEVLFAEDLISWPNTCFLARRAKYFGSICGNYEAISPLIPERYEEEKSA